VNGFPDQMPRGQFGPGRMPYGLHDGMRFFGGRGGFEHHDGHHWIFFVFFALLLLALVLLIASMARGMFWRGAVSTTTTAVASGDDAVSVLRLRYARGEIGRDEFMLAHGDLGGGSPPPEAHPA
jgi:uncharacterized membrane protein